MKSDRKFELVLYPDSTSYDTSDVLLRAIRYWDYWAYITHDKDIDDDGLLKKSHIHFIGRNKEDVITPAGVMYHLGIPENAIQQIRYWKSAVQYLIHKNAPDKVQYGIEDITSNFDVSMYFKDAKDETEEAQRIINFIYQTESTDIKTLVDFALNNNLWATFRRGYSIYKELMKGDV